MQRRPPTRTVGSRELKTRLGTYLRQVRGGDRLIVTERGRPIAELRPLERPAGDLESALRDLVVLGLITDERLRGGVLPPFEPLQGTGPPVSQAIVEDRGDRV